MYVRKLTLTNFRNYESLKAEFDNQRIFLIGNNGVGKTNIIEAVYFLTITHSFRKADNHSLIRQGSDEACVYLEYFSENDQKNHTLSCLIGSSSKLIELDGEKVRTTSALLGNLIAVCYEPSMVSFFKDEPETRRRLMNETLCLISKEYLTALKRYNDLLKRRNAALQKESPQDLIDAYRTQLNIQSYRIVKERKDFLAKIAEKAKEYYAKLFGDTAKQLTLRYHTACPREDNQESFIAQMNELFQSNQSKENILKTTVIGPHRDDLKAELNGNDVGLYGSQGENRLASLSLKLAILDLLADAKGKRPVLLLDDITSDLDSVRCQNLLNCINRADQQVFITGAKIREEFKHYEIYTAENGHLVRTGGIQDE